MATPRQIAANRRNAENSTGPRTPEGKAISSRNNTRHGIRSQDVVIEKIGESHADFDQLAGDYLDDCRPRGPRQAFLVRLMAEQDWMCRRISRAENGEWARCSPANRENRPAANAALGATFWEDCKSDGKAFLNFVRYGTSHRNAWHRANRELQRLQQLPPEPDWLDLAFEPRAEPLAEPQPVPAIASENQLLNCTAEPNSVEPPPNQPPAAPDSVPEPASASSPDRKTALRADLRRLGRLTAGLERDVNALK